MAFFPCYGVCKNDLTRLFLNLYGATHRQQSDSATFIVTSATFSVISDGSITGNLSHRPRHSRVLSNNRFQAADRQQRKSPVWAGQKGQAMSPMAEPYSANRNDTAQHPDCLISAKDQAEQTSNAPLPHLFGGFWTVLHVDVQEYEPSNSLPRIISWLSGLILMQLISPTRLLLSSPFVLRGWII